MDSNEKKLSDYIDRLNAERKPDEHEHPPDSEELKELLQTVRMVRSLKEPAMPEADFSKKLVQSRKKPAAARKWTWVTAVASLVAIFVLMMNFLPFGKTNIVNAMAAAYRDVNAYHGFLEITSTNAKGESTTQAKMEVWADQEGHYYIKGLEGTQKDTITVNNGEQKWQINPSDKQVHVFPAFPDPYRFTFELGMEIKDVKNALTTKVVGEDTIAGRKTSILEVSPKGGESYRIWIDNETKLPLQKQLAMHNAIQYTMTYTKMDFSQSIPKELKAYGVPTGFKEMSTNPEQFVTDLIEAEKVLGFMPSLPKAIPSGYSQDKLAIVPSLKWSKIYYTNKNAHVVVIQGKAAGEFKPVPTAILGKINQNPAEIQTPVYENAGVLGGGAYAGATQINSIRWQQDGFEYAVVGDVPVEELALFTNGTLKMPALDDSKAQVEVPYDLTVEENDQKSVDAGSSPWKLDPVFVSQVFVSLQIFPNGITGDYPIKQEELKVLTNNGTEAIIEVTADNTPIKKVYLKRLVRQDSTGIWTVVGYDPSAKK